MSYRIERFLIIDGDEQEDFHCIPVKNIVNIHGTRGKKVKVTSILTRAQGSDNVTYRVPYAFGTVMKLLRNVAAVADVSDVLRREREEL